MLNDALLREVVKTKAIMFVGPEIMEKYAVYKYYCFLRPITKENL